MENVIEKKVFRIRTEFVNPVFILIGDNPIRLSNVFLYDDLNTAFLGHLKLFYNEAPFYFTFDRKHLRKLLIKGYKDAFFLPNLFKLKYDKYGKMFLACNPDMPNTMLKYHSIGGYINDKLNIHKGMEDLRNLVIAKRKNPDIYAGFKYVKNKLSLLGEAIEIIKF